MLKVIADTEAETSQIDMPLPKGMELLKTDSEEVLCMVRFDGICHMIVPGKPRDRKFVETVLGKSQKNLPLRSMGDHVPGREQDGPGGLCGKHRLSDLGEQLCQRQYGCGSLSVQRGKKTGFLLILCVSREGRYVRKFIKKMERSSGARWAAL